jgi:hypothetical protein
MKSSRGWLKIIMFCWFPLTDGLKIKVARSSETSVNFYQATLRNIPENIGHQILGEFRVAYLHETVIQCRVEMRDYSEV